MYCKYCGKPVPEGAVYCLSCGKYLNGSEPNENDSSSFGFALLGFLFPLIGLILYFVYDDKRPKRAKSVGKGALVGVITRIVISIVITVAAFFFSFSVFNAVATGEASDIPIIGSVIDEMIEELDDDGSDKCEINVGEFSTVKRSGYDATTLELTVRNITDELYSYGITVDAYDADGTRIGTEYVFVENLEPGQTAKAAAFEDINSTQVEAFENARFEISAIHAFCEYR